MMAPLPLGARRVPTTPSPVEGAFEGFAETQTTTTAVNVISLTSTLLLISNLLVDETTDVQD